MKSFAKHLIIGLVIACGLGLTPLMAQHEGHGHGPGGHGKGHKAAAPAALPKCPIANEPINLASKLKTDDGPVFFCCDGCISRYQKNPAKFASVVADQRKALAKRAKIQVICPVSGNPVSDDIFVESDGQKVHFCCKDCLKKYKNNPSDYSAALANSYTYQTMCPVMDEEINPSVFTTTAKGENIYFCCKGCDKKFVKNSGKYAPKLVSQGYTFEPRDLVPSKDDHSGHGH